MCRPTYSIFLRLLHLPAFRVRYKRLYKLQSLNWWQCYQSTIVRLEVREREREVTFTFIIPARTAPPRYTICFLRGGSSIRNRSFCSPLDIENIRGSSSIKKIGSIHNCCTTISGSLANHYLL